MYTEIIEKLNPLPKFNLNWYSGEDKYSDGNIEDTIIRLIAENDSDDYTEVIYNHFGWPTYYYLVRTRKNIINWYPFKEDADVLEIGCGLGAITGELCDRCHSVTAVELSKRRATAALLRCREKENLEIIVGNLNDISFEKKFDYITLIGVLEYQEGYTDTQNPFCDFLKKIKGLLKPDGKLLIAIENKYGLKYWCGAPEDHTGIPFLGLNQYSLTNRKVKTFSKEELSGLVKESGFKNQYFYYPLPDYKLPTVIYSQNYLPSKEEIHRRMRCYYVNNETLIAKESALYGDVIDNGVFEFFANSFLVECSDAEDVGECTYASLNDARAGEYRLGIRIFGEKIVERFPVSLDSNIQNHMYNCQKNIEKISEKGLWVIEQKFDGKSILTPYWKEISAEEYLLSIYKKGDREEILSVFQRLYEQIIQSSDEVDWEENAIYNYDLNVSRDKEKFGVILKDGYMDMIFQNAFYYDNHFVWYDQEWKLEKVPAKYIIYRAVLYLYSGRPELQQILPSREVFDYFGIDNEMMDIFGEVEVMFQGIALDGKHRQLSGVFQKESSAACQNNIAKIVNNSGTA